MTDRLAQTILSFRDAIPDGASRDARAAFGELRALLDRGTVRAATRDARGRWQATEWVKVGILLGFRLGQIVDQSGDGPLRLLDKDTLPLKTIVPDDQIRVVPGGSSIRDGAYVAPGVVCMPPMYINIGAYVDEGAMVDSHALVGSCAQIGKRVHLSAAAQIGGVLEPPGAVPVIIEDDVLVGGNCGVYEGTIVRERAVLAPGTVLTGGVPVFDLVRDQVYRRTASGPLEIPEGAVVVPGSRPVTTGAGKRHGIALYAPVIVKYRDEKTDTAVKIEELLRPTT